MATIAAVYGTKYIQGSGHVVNFTFRRYRLPHIHSHRPLSHLPYNLSSLQAITGTETPQHGIHSRYFTAWRPYVRYRTFNLKQIYIYFKISASFLYYFLTPTPYIFKHYPAKTPKIIFITYIPSINTSVTVSPNYDIQPSFQPPFPVRPDRQKKGISPHEDIPCDMQAL